MMINNLDDIKTIVTNTGAIHIQNNMLNNLNYNDIRYVIDKNDRCSSFNIEDNKIIMKDFKFYKDYRLLVNEDGFKYYFYTNLNNDIKYLFNKAGYTIETSNKDINEINSMLMINNSIALYETYNISTTDDLYMVKVKRYTKNLTEINKRDIIL